MRFKRGSQGPRDMVCCPVCTLYLREEVTLQEHLDTHPKQQVIEALVRVKDACRDVFSQPAPAVPNKKSASGSGNSNNNSGSLSNATAAKPTGDTVPNSSVPVTLSSAASSTETTLASVPHIQMAPTSANHFIPYPQFLSSLGGAAVVPQYVSLPLVSADGSSQQTGAQAPVMQMLYNPYMYTTSASSGSSAAGSSETLEHTAHVQYLTPSGVIRSPFHILQTAPGPTSSQTPTPPTFMDGMIQAPTVAAPLNPEQAHFHLRVQSSAGNRCESLANSGRSADQDDEHEVEVNVEAMSPRREIDLGSPSARRMRDWYNLGSPGAHSTCSTEGGLRVRTDLSIASISSPPPSTVMLDEFQETEQTSHNERPDSEGQDIPINHPNLNSSKSHSVLAAKESTSIQIEKRQDRKLDSEPARDTSEQNVTQTNCDRAVEETNPWTTKELTSDEMEVDEETTGSDMSSTLHATASKSSPELKDSLLPTNVQGSSGLTPANQFSSVETVALQVGPVVTSAHYVGPGPVNVNQLSSEATSSHHTTPEPTNAQANAGPKCVHQTSSVLLNAQDKDSPTTSAHEMTSKPGHVCQTVSGPSNSSPSSAHEPVHDSANEHQVTLQQTTGQVMSNLSTSCHTQSLPSSTQSSCSQLRVLQTNTHMTNPHPTLSASPFIQHTSTQSVYMSPTSVPVTAYHVRQGWLGSSITQEIITPDISYSQEHTLEEAHNSHIIETEGRTLFSLGSAPGAVSVVRMDGVRVLMPSQFVGDVSDNIVSPAKYDQGTESLSPGRPHSPASDSGPPSPYQKYVDSPVPLNIQTDETMPPRGELSEQESNGGNSSSMWFVPPYQIARDLLSPVVSTSYDLTARESWAGSDMSDNECNANPAPEVLIHRYSPLSADNSGVATQETNTAAHRYNVPPSFSNTLPSLLLQQPIEEVIDKKPLIPAQAQVRGPATTKTTPKPRVYKCKACTLEFSCPKERRVHKCEKKKEKEKSKDPVALVDGDLSMAGSSADKPKPKRAYKRKPKATMVKKEDVEDRMSGQSRFADAFVEAAYVNKMEPEEASGQTLPHEISVSLLKQDPQIQSGADISPFVQESHDITDQDLDFKQLYKEHRCTTCGIGFTRAKDLARHRTLKHKELRYQCATCGETFGKESDYFDHLLIHPLECRLCGKCFNRRKSLNLHMKWHMDIKPYKCDSCDKSFVTKQKLDEHKNTHTGNAPIKCPHCEETFKRYSNLIQHKNRHHLNVKKKVKDYICQCGEIFHSRKKLEWHKEIHDDKPKSCQFCSERFVHTASLTRHVRKAHDRRYVPKVGREVENVECPVCKCVFLKSSLATHMRIHSGERPFSCHICGKDFTTKWNLQLHRWTHASRSSKPFKCTLCKAAFYRKQDYNSHMRSHRNVRPFTCNHCGCQFIRKYNCLRHMKEHEEGKSYSCTICQKTFHRSYYLKDHMRVHSGVRPFTCHICGKASSTKSNHNKHVRIHHAREPQNTEI